VRFDKFSEEDFAANTIPDGHNEVVVKKVSDVSLCGIGDRCVIVFQDTNDSYDEVTLWLNPDDKRNQRAATELNGALGRSWNDSIDESIVGSRLVIQTKKAFKDGQPKLDKHGKQVVYVNGFMPTAGEPVAAEAPRSVSKRTATQKADAATGAPADDIPF
jgi:hypothetical protein